MKYYIRSADVNVDTRDIKKQGSIMCPNEHNNPLDLDPKLKESYEMTDIELKMIIRNLSDIQETADRLKK